MGNGTTSDTVTIRLRYMDVGEFGLDTLFADRAQKCRTLAALGIDVPAEQKPLEAWLHAMSRENGLPVSTPVHADIAQAVTMDRAAQKFVWYLA